ncbi:unnamed protein product [Paramecium sonneborni]|uniref:Uncharacterized protein n=1 Tax=Paramecium sonneborni TaxID=65129 RepID=A0A8S1N685_9CILI|nr:unnamed protein product [Paramecium sonneborni]CAD8085621.1 unnamed protein product [Paramecium sonneborni]
MPDLNLNIPQMYQLASQGAGEIIDHFKFQGPKRIDEIEADVIEPTNMFQQNPLQYNGLQTSQISLHPNSFIQYKLDGQSGQILLVGLPQQQPVHQLKLGPVHQEQDEQHQGLIAKIFLIETYASPEPVEVNYIFDDVLVVKLKFRVLTSADRVSQNPLVIGYTEGKRTYCESLVEFKVIQLIAGELHVINQAQVVVDGKTKKLVYKYPNDPVQILQVSSLFNIGNINKANEDQKY